MVHVQSLWLKKVRKSDEAAGSGAAVGQGSTMYSMEVSPTKEWIHKMFTEDRRGAGRLQLIAQLCGSPSLSNCERPTKQRNPCLNEHKSFLVPLSGQFSAGCTVLRRICGSLSGYIAACEKSQPSHSARQGTRGFLKAFP